MKKTLSLILAFVMIAAFSSCGKKKQELPVAVSDSQEINNSGKLRIGITELKPFNYKEKGKWCGFDTELAEEVAKILNLKAEFVVINWSERYSKLNNREIDCIWNGMTLTDEAKLIMNCSNPYAYGEQVIVMPADKVSGYNDGNSLKPLKIAVEERSANAKFAADNGFDSVVVSTPDEEIAAVKSGSADACILSSGIADAYVGEGTENSGLQKGISLAAEEYCVGFRSGSDMKMLTDNALAQIKESGKLKELAEKYNIKIQE